MDAVRHFLGVFGVVAYPPALLFWFVIHPWARAWRGLGPTVTYLVIVLVTTFWASLLFQVRSRLLGADLGTSWILVGLALPFYAVSIWLDPICRGQLPVRTLLGAPELSRTSEGRAKPLTGGVYRLVRHPRYLSAAIGGIGFALIVNYVGMYAVALASLPTLYAIAVLEERELINRFG